MWIRGSVWSSSTRPSSSFGTFPVRRNVSPIHASCSTLRAHAASRGGGVFRSQLYAACWLLLACGIGRGCFCLAAWCVPGTLIVFFIGVIPCLLRRFGTLSVSCSAGWAVDSFPFLFSLPPACCPVWSVLGKSVSVDRSQLSIRCLASPCPVTVIPSGWPGTLTRTRFVIPSRRLGSCAGARAALSTTSARGLTFRVARRGAALVRRPPTRCAGMLRCRCIRPGPMFPASTAFRTGSSLRSVRSSTAGRSPPSLTVMRLCVPSWSGTVSRTPSLALS